MFFILGAIVILVLMGLRIVQQYQTGVVLTILPNRNTTPV